MRRAGLAPLLLAVAALLLPAPLLAETQESLGVTPPVVEVGDGQRGQDYRRDVTVQNQFDSPTRITLERGGEVGGWTRSLPEGPFDMPPRSTQDLALTLSVPGDTPNGNHSGVLRVIAEAKQQPNGSGFALRTAVAVVLNVSVGGEAVVKLRWLNATAEDVEEGTLPRLLVGVANEGNVRTTAAATAQVALLGAQSVVARWNASREVVPGQTLGLLFPADRPLPLGDYEAEVRAAPPDVFTATAAFRVCEPGCVGKSGELRFLQHEPRAEAGLPVRVVAVFENTGTATIARAKFAGEALLEGRLLAVLASDELAVGPGERAQLTAYFTPPAQGTYTLRGKVTYDRFATLPNESLLEVSAASGGAGAPPSSWLALPALAVLAALGLWFLKRRRRAG